MHIVFVSNLYPPFSLGGYEQICFDIAQELRSRGHDIQVLTSTYRAGETWGDDGAVHRLLKLRSTWISPAASRSTAVGRSWVEVDWHNFRTFQHTLKALQPDAVMIWNGGHLGSALLWEAERYGCASYYLSDAWLAPILAQQGEESNVQLSRRVYR